MADFLIFYIPIFLLLIATIIGVIYFTYWLPKKLGNKKLGIILSRSLIVVLSVFLLFPLFEDSLFFKSDARRILAEYKINLNNDFKIISNKTDNFYGYDHQFELEISENDKKTIIQQIKLAKNYQDTTKSILITKDIFIPANTNRLFYSKFLD